MISHRFNPENLINYLIDNNLEFTLYEHVAVFTCEEAKQHLGHINALGTKNLFLREEKGPRVFLVTVSDSKRVDLNKLRFELKSERLTFGKPELLWECLAVEPGSVTVFGIANDTLAKVELFIDTTVMSAALIQAHPLRNTASLTFKPSMLNQFLKLIEREAREINVPEKERDIPYTER
jgi:Ala-tRNA(Pro) deacylase